MVLSAIRRIWEVLANMAWRRLVCGEIEIAGCSTNGSMSWDAPVRLVAASLDVPSA